MHVTWLLIYEISNQITRRLLMVSKWHVALSTLDSLPIIIVLQLINLAVNRVQVMSWPIFFLVWFRWKPALRKEKYGRKISRKRLELYRKRRVIENL